MIKINGDIVTINKFPDGTPRINIDVNMTVRLVFGLIGYMKAMMRCFI